MNAQQWVMAAVATAMIGTGACSSAAPREEPDGETGGATTSATTITGTTTTTTTTTGTNTNCGSLEVSEDAACQGCAESSCCSEMAACDAGTDCGDLLLCAEDCAADDQACIQDCAATYPDGVTPINELYDCLDAQCTDECGGAVICDSTLYYESVALMDCVNANCCDSFTPCFEDADCQACLLDPEGVGCDTNALLAAYKACRDESCPLGVCTSDIGFYESETNEPLFECNVCAGENCCSDLDTCDGDGSDTAMDLCLTCLNTPEDATCLANSTVHDAAVAFNGCVSSSCAQECGE